jgi:hypothetical protein
MPEFMALSLVRNVIRLILKTSWRAWWLIPVIQASWEKIRRIMVEGYSGQKSL